MRLGLAPQAGRAWPGCVTGAQRRVFVLLSVLAVTGLALLGAQVLHTLGVIQYGWEGRERPGHGMEDGGGG